MGTLTVTSGAIVADHTTSIGVTTLAFGTAEGLIDVGNGVPLTVTSAITGSNGLTICLEDWTGTTANVFLGGAYTYTGVTTIEGNNTARRLA